ncbi:hypothetical protein EJ05DRAFT_70165 [Pseudovirgaria hyperparasitica]|uniref:Uncharacterized protein n=1 Tax=Pseudovirgaria hyperparasitica TaxID=470096 RepID=A0A6A6W3R9_9PEZI|nr:uncharacterized protein EJ05DRAFT_70165 [Pseudovirgaria hyperparasitica]KAF2756616.1 hypothetical protein EJ05DRAFT_70165 [Pseudovirgaria hyperparasitica]
MSSMDRPPQHPRSKSTFSFKSEKSHKSQGSTSTKTIKETAEEKRKSHFTPTGKADPNAAMNEAQPTAALEKSTLAPLRSFSHLDTFGNPIAEPDLSNPTRPRWERPLDTIKSFEAAIDTEYKRRTLLRADTAPDAASTYQSRRSSYFAGNNERTQTRHSNIGGCYGNGNGGARENYNDQTYAPPVAGPSRNRYNQRMMSDPQAGRYNNGAPVYPNAGYQQSRDTVNTGVSGSGSEPWTNTTDPSSENSSIERNIPVNRADAADQYAFTGFGSAPIMEEYGPDANYSCLHMAPTGTYSPPNYPNALAPTVPPKNSSGKSHIPLGISPSTTGEAVRNNESRPRTLSRRESSGDKRKSWFKRKFSKD